MINRKIIFSAISILILLASSGQAQKGKHTFEVRNSELILDKKPYQVISGEMHPSRIPVDYWEHRIKMAKAMGLNTITASIFWNYHELKEGEFDFNSDNRDLTRFLTTMLEEKMWLILKTGPMTGAQWEFAGLPSYLLRSSITKLRSDDATYAAAVERYIKELALILKPFQVKEGGPLLMIQVEDGEATNTAWLKKLWSDSDIDVPVVQESEAIDQVNLFTSEKDNGSCIHWGEKWAEPDTAGLIKKIRSLMDGKKSFNLYMVHGGTNFGFSSGSCIDGNNFQPDITSYDLGAPISEQGSPTPLFMTLKGVLDSYMPKGKKAEEIPDSIRIFEIPALSMQPFTSVWDNLPRPVTSEHPKAMEEYGQDYGYILYKTSLTGQKTGKLTVTDVHDYATVFLDGQYLGSLDRTKGINSIDVPASQAEVPVIEILVEAMGRIRPEPNLMDRKGITEKVTLNDAVLTNWSIYNIPMDWKFIYDLRSTGRNLKKPGIFFKGNFSLIDNADTFFDISGYTKGMVWINGHNLGRFWNSGPQRRFYCPASWIKTGMNEIIVFDIEQTQPRPFSASTTMD